MKRYNDVKDFDDSLWFNIVLMCIQVVGILLNGFIIYFFVWMSIEMGEVDTISVIMVIVLLLIMFALIVSIILRLWRKPWKTIKQDYWKKQEHYLGS